MTDGPAVSVRDLRRTFGATTALDGVTFDVRQGEMFGLIGPDGAGKTTLLRLATGLDRPTSGEVRVANRDPFAARGLVTASVGYLAQRFSLYGDLTIDENIEFFARLHGVADFKAKRDRLLDLTGLTAFRTRLADRLSGGMKQKLALSCTLIHEPKLLILDEPTTGVDPVSRREFWKLLAEFLSRGLTILLATPYLDEAERCHRVALLHSGRVLALDEPTRLRAALPGVMVEVVVPDARRARDVVASIVGEGRVELFGDRLHVRLDTRAAADALPGELASRGVSQVRVRPVVASLEDVFIDLLTAVRTDSSPAATADVRGVHVHT